MEPQTTSFWAQYSFEIFTILAIVLGPILAVQAQKMVERRKADKQRKIEIFKTLMATRGSNLTPSHIQALNLIDLEFHKEDKYEEVIDAWGEYLDNLKLFPESDASAEAFQIWNAKNSDLLANLLFKMGRSLGYKFDKVHIKRNSYTPKGPSEAENEWNYIRQGLVKMIEFGGIPTYIAMSEEEEKKQADFQDLLKKYIQNPVQVKVVNDNPEDDDQPK